MRPQVLLKPDIDTPGRGRETEIKREREREREGERERERAIDRFTQYKTTELVTFACTAPLRKGSTQRRWTLLRTNVA
jgi:hypothetical protein